MIADIKRRIYRQNGENKTMHEDYSKSAITGFWGAVLFMIGDCLLYIYPGRDAHIDIDPVFAVMPVWRFTASAFLGFFGMALML